MNLGTATNFAVLAATPVLSNTGPTQILTGDIGISPAASITGFGPGVVVAGAQHPNDGVAQSAHADAQIAFTDAFNRPSQPLPVADIGGHTYGPGVYRAASTLGITGTVTLDGTGFPNAVYIFQVPTSLTTATTNSNVALINVNPCNVFWVTGAAATLGTFTNFKGTIISQTAITINTGVNMVGRALDTGASVSLDSDTITIPPGP